MTRWLPNRVNPRENFADKWAEHPRKVQLFFEWLDGIERKHQDLLTDRGFEKAGQYLCPEKSANPLPRMSNCPLSRASLGGRERMHEEIAQLVMGQMDNVQAQHPGLELTLAPSGELRVRGALGFGIGHDGRTVADTYQIELHIPGDYPDSPRARTKPRERSRMSLGIS